MCTASTTRLLVLCLYDTPAAWWQYRPWRGRDSGALQRPWLSYKVRYTGNELHSQNVPRAQCHVTRKATAAVLQPLQSHSDVPNPEPSNRPARGTLEERGKGECEARMPQMNVEMRESRCRGCTTQPHWQPQAYQRRYRVILKQVARARAPTQS